MAITISGQNNNDKILASDGVLDQISGFNVVGVMTATTFDVTTKHTANHIDVGSSIQLGNAGIITATTLIGNVTGNVNSTSHLLLQISGSEKFRVGNGGQLGIGGANYGTSGQVLTSGGSGSAPTWTTISSDKIQEGNTFAEVIDTGSNGVFTVSTEGNERLRVDSSGNMSLGKGAAASTNYGQNFQIHSNSTNGAALHLTDNSTGNSNSDGFHIISTSSIAYLWQRENANMIFGTNSSSRWNIYGSNGHFAPSTDSTYDIGTSSKRVRNGYFDTLYGDGSNLTGITGTTINNNANNRIITGSGTANTLEGESTFTFDGTKVHLNAGSTSHIQIDGTSSYLQVAGIKVWVGAGNRAHNTAVGNGALNSANGGDDCTAVGHNAYANGTSGEDNTVVGSHALDAAVTGHRNCAFGHASLSALTSGYNNSCYGRTSGFYLLNGHNNTFLGYDAGFSDTSGSYNIYAGSGAGMYETTSSDNVAIGYKCFGAEKSGGNSNQFNKNTVVGHQALAQQRISNGDGENVCLGYRAMYNTQTAAWRNVVIGFEAGYNNQAAYTTFVGTFAGKDYQSGGNTMCLGYNAGTTASPSGSLTNQQDTICLGNNIISNFYCSDTSISSSDARDKTDITEWTHGLSFINQLKPITYRWDKRTWYGTDEEPIGTPDGSKKKARLHLGFLAQDALEVEKSFGYASKKDDMLAVNLNEDNTAYGMKYERLVVPLTKAVQELSAEVDALKAKVAALEGS